MNQTLHCIAVTGYRRVVQWGAMRGRRFIVCVLAVWIALQVATTAVMPWMKCCADGHETPARVATALCHPELDGSHDHGGSHDHHAAADSDHHAGHAGASDASEHPHHGRDDTSGPALRCLCGISADTLGILLNAHAVIPDLMALSTPITGARLRTVPFFPSDHLVVVDSPPPRL